MIPVQLLILFFVLLINTAILWVIVSQGWRTIANRYFAGSVFSVFLWAAGTALFYAASTEELAALGLLLFYVAPMFTITFLSLFATKFGYSRKSRLVDIYDIVLGVITVSFAALIVINPSVLTSTIELSSSGNILRVNPVGYSVYTLYFNIAFFIAFIKLFLGALHHKGQQRQQFIYVFIGTFLTACFSLVTNLTMPVLGNATLIWVGPTSSLFYIATVTYSIVKHGLFDIRQAAVRTVAYSFSLIVLAAIYYLFAYVVSIALFRGETSTEVSVSPINILLALLLAFIFQPVKQFFDRITDRIFYHDRYLADEFYARLSEVLTTTTDLRSLLQHASKEIGSTMKAEQAFFFVQYNHVHHISAGNYERKGGIPLHDIRTLNNYVNEAGGKVIVTELLQGHTDVRRLLVSHKIAVLMPLMRDTKVLGYLALGDHQGSGYTNRDIRVLNTISDELVIAIQNSLSVQEVKDINEHLQQRINEATHQLRTSNARLRRIDATKDEFLSMASHQLRTPLTSIKGYLSMVLEGDAGKVTAMQKHLLSEAFTGSERMVHLIHDFLNVSRIQTGKFLIEKKEFDLVDLLKDEVKSLVSAAELRGLKLKTELPKESMVMKLDESKMRQVVMNFIDNAIYYSKPNTTILVTLTTGRSSVKVKVIDHGIGVPVAQQEKLFTKFFRADNARKQRPDGTGVGLYLAKKVIDGHGGKLIFASKENEGSTFGFELPRK